MFGLEWARAESQTGRPPNDIASTVRRVRGLMEVREVSRAAAAVWGRGESRTAQQVITKFATTQPRQGPARRLRALPPALPEPLRQRIHRELVKGFKQFPRKSGSGPGGPATSTGPPSPRTPTWQPTSPRA